MCGGAPTLALCVCGSWHLACVAGESAGPEDKSQCQHLPETV